jgi:hypothetical protein
MAMKDFSSDEPLATSTLKKPYEKPSFRYEQVFVTSALTCGKHDPASQTCVTNMKVS